MQAKKHLGQHFLKSEKALKQIIDAGDIQTTDTILEIGPGTGILTNQLLQKAGKVVAVEKDRELIEYLTQTYATDLESKKLTILDKDILEFDPLTMEWYGKQYKLIANIPYYITGAIIEQFLSTTFQPERMVLLIQKEVAERIIARDGKESVLSIAIKAYGTPRIIDKVPRGAFNPPPKVDSAIIAIKGISRTFFSDCDESVFFSVVKSIFGKKRKQLGGSLSEYLQNKTLAHTILATAKIDPTVRPETMSLAQWKQLVQLVHGEQNRVQ